jgi:dTDP-4-dehydrorhamnose 3,5-epimerase
MVASYLENAVPAEVLREFVADAPRPRVQAAAGDLLEGRIEGCQAFELLPASDDRGDLFELLTLRDRQIEPIVHVYQVYGEPGSVRAWVYHSRQTDRLCFTQGSFRIALCDLRTGSRSAGSLVTLLAGASAPRFLTIPPYVAHGVQNTGAERAAFLNMPTDVYRHETPDKHRLPSDSPLIPFRW